MLVKTIKIIAPSLLRFRIIPKSVQRFSSNRFDELAESLTAHIHKEQLIKNQTEEEILKNYLELTEQSYLENLLQLKKQAEENKGKIDYKIILMVLPTLEQEETIQQHLVMLFPHLHLLKNKELQLFYEYLLAHKTKEKPKLPSPKSLVGAESLLVLLGEIYPKDLLVDWLTQIPLYNGQSTYILAMGAFSIISQLSQNNTIKHQALIKRCYERIYELWLHCNSEERTGVILLALETNLPFAEELILEDYSLEFQEVDGLKLGLLVVELDGYLKKHYNQVTAIGPKKQTEDFQQQGVDIDEGVDKVTKPPPQKRYVYNPQNPSEVKYHLQQFLYKLIKFLRKQDWTGIVKLHQMVKFYNVLQGKKLQKEWLKFAFKLFNFTVHKQQATALVNLTTHEIVNMLEVAEQLKINKPELIKQLLVILSDRLEQAEAQELVRLSKCLVTYVRLCEDYLIHFRQIIERRKYIFNYDQIQTLNQIFKRVQVLFPKPLIY